MPRRLVVRVLLVAACAVPGGVYWASAGPAAAPAKRVPWATPHVTGSPEPPPPFVVVDAFPGVKFDKPLHVTFQRDLGRAFVSEQGGPVYSFDPDRPPAGKGDVFFDPKGLKKLGETPNGNGFETVYGLAFHPKFRANRQCFVCYTVRGKDGVANLPDGSRVSRFTVPAGDGPPRIDPASEVILLTFLQGGHNGGDLHFGPDGMLYVSTGDAANPNPPDVFRTGQDVSDLLSSILRIDVDKPDAGKAYGVPADNPFVGTQATNGKPARGEVWAYGYRNPWRMSFDRATGELWVGDVGWELWETVHKATRGGNAGWSVTEARQAVNTDEPRGPTPVIPPVIEIPHTAGASMTGGYVYRGTRLPELVGQYIFGDWETRRIWAAKLTPAGTLESLKELVKPSARVVAFGQDPAGELVFLDYDAGTVHRLERSTAAGRDPSKFPRTLAATGLFADPARHAVAPGVRRFDIVSPQWQDHATAERFLAVPGTGTVRDVEDRKPLPGAASWHTFRYQFPADAVLVKTLSLDAAQGDPASARRVETQLAHFDGTGWNYYTYAWRPDQSDADLVPADGAEATITVRDPAYAGGVREQTWQFASRAQCGQCHNSWAEFTLAFRPDQLNRPVDTPGGVTNQLADLAAAGFVTRVGKPVENEATLADPHGAGPLADRAKAYLHANCGHCHRFGGGGAVDFQLHSESDLADAKLRARPVRGTFDIPDPKVIHPGKPGQSVALYRMAKFGGGRMPHLGAELPDPRGLKLVSDWIASLAPGTKSTGPVPAAVELACRFPGLPEADRAAAVATVAAWPAGPARDLFDGYLAVAGREKKLGPNPKPAAVLAKTGDAGRGAALFRSAKAQCATCHQVAGEGKAVGPELTKIGAARTRDHLLESLLEPSKQIEPAYQAYLLTTADGRALTGTLVSKSAAEVVLRLADGTETRVPAADVEAFKPAAQSLMPAGLLADLTAQQAADLLEYLATRK